MNEPEFEPQGGQEAPPQDNEQKALPQDKPPVTSEETIREAREMGWVPRENFRGNPEQWRPAEEFVRRGREVLPIVRADRDALRREIEALRRQRESDQAQFQDRFSRLEQVNEAVLQRQRDTYLAELTAEKDRAAVEGNLEAYHKLNQAENQVYVDEARMQQEAQQQYRRQSPPQQSMSPEDQYEVNSWTLQNDWFMRDPVLNAYAQEVHVGLNQAIQRGQIPPMNTRENLARTAEEVRKRFPEKFGQPFYSPPQRRADGGGGYGFVEGGGRMAASPSHGRGWEDLPPEAKQSGQKFINEGLYGSDHRKAREMYASEYWKDGD